MPDTWAARDWVDSGAIGYVADIDAGDGFMGLFKGDLPATQNATVSDFTQPAGAGLAPNAVVVGNMHQVEANVMQINVYGGQFVGGDALPDEYADGYFIATGNTGADSVIYAAKFPEPLLFPSGLAAYEVYAKIRTMGLLGEVVTQIINGE